MTKPGLFVTGTDTGVGKTHVTSQIAASLTARGRRIGVLKPVATGAYRVEGELRSDDTDRLIEAIGGNVPRERVTSFVFEEPLAPPVAARRQGTPLSHLTVVRAALESIQWWSERAEGVLVEGVGGLMCPLAEGTTVLDLALALDYPLLLVARRGLGTLNHTLLTLEAVSRRGLRMAGIVLNQTEPGGDLLAQQTNADELSRRVSGIPILLDLPHAASGSLREIDSVDWFERLEVPRYVDPSAAKLVECGTG